MTDSPAIIDIRPDEWVDLYEVAGLVVGTPMVVQNIGTADVFLSTSLTRPELDSTNYQKLIGNDIPFVNKAGDNKAWARTASAKTSISVRPLGQSWSPYIDTESPAQGASREANQSVLLAALNELRAINDNMLIELRLLNARFEEISETDIERDDVNAN